MQRRSGISLQLPKIISVAFSIIGTSVYYSISKTSAPLQTLLMVISIDVLLFFSLIYSLFHFSIHSSKCLKCLLFFFESQSIRRKHLFVIRGFTLYLIIFSAVISSALISFTSSAWLATYFFGMIPVVYMLHLLEFRQNPFGERKLSDYRRQPFTYAICIIVGTCVLILSEVDKYNVTEVRRITGPLTTFGLILCFTIYFQIFDSYLAKILASLTTFTLYIPLAVTMVNGSRDGDFELMNICLFFGAAIPIFLISTSIYFRTDISVELKNSIFLGFWTLLYIPSMSLITSHFLYKGQNFFCDVINLSFLAFGFYCLVIETIFRLQQFKGREDKHMIFACFVTLPLSIAVTFFNYGKLSTTPFIIFLSISFGILVIMGIAYYPIKIMSSFSYRVSSKETGSVLWYEETLSFMFSILWKFFYMIAICFITRKLYLYDYTDKKSDQWIVSQGLIILLSALGHSLILENVIFFVKEKDHVYPSLRKVSLINTVLPSLLRDEFIPVKKKWQVIVLIIFVVSEVISFTCLAASTTMFFMILFNLGTAILFIVAFETKLRTWDTGNKVSAEFLIFVWSFIYIPVVCGASVISTTTILGDIDATSSLIIFFIIIAFCIQLGLFSGDIYEKVTDVKYATLNAALEQKGYSMNYRNLIIEDFINNNLKNFEIIDGDNSYSKYAESQYALDCRKCRLGIDHDAPGFYYESNQIQLYNFLLLQPEPDPAEPVEPEKSEEEKEPMEEEEPSEIANVPIQKEKLNITQTKVISFREFFKMGQYDTIVKKFDFVNSLAEIYREEINQGKITRNDFFIIFLGITHDVSKQVTLKFDADFVKKVLRGLARLIYNKVDEHTLVKVEKELLTRMIPVKPPTPPPAKPMIEVPVVKENFFKYEYKKTVTATASKAYLMANTKSKNSIDYLVPYSLIKINTAIEESKSKSVLEYLRLFNKELEEEEEIRVGTVENISYSFQLLFFASIFNMYSLTTVALDSRIKWLKDAISFNTGIIPAKSNWLVSMILSYSLMFIFFVFTITLFVLIKKKKTSPRIIAWGKAFMIVITSGMLVENLIFLLTNLTCAKDLDTNKFGLNGNPEIPCLGSVHIALLVISIVLFIFYFFLAQVFYPSLYKLSTRMESYFNVEIHCKVIYATIASCVIEQLMNFKLVLCLILGVVLVLYSFYRIKMNRNSSKFKGDLIEYLIVVWIYFWALLANNNVLTSDAFIILIVTIVVYSIYAQRSLIVWIYTNVKRCLQGKRQITPQGGVINLTEVKPANKTNIIDDSKDSEILFKKTNPKVNTKGNQNPKKEDAKSPGIINVSNIDSNVKTKKEDAKNPGFIKVSNIETNVKKNASDAVKTPLSGKKK